MTTQQMKEISDNVAAGREALETALHELTQIVTKVQFRQALMWAAVGTFALLLVSTGGTIGTKIAIEKWEAKRAQEASLRVEKIMELLPQLERTSQVRLPNGKPKLEVLMRRLGMDTITEEDRDRACQQMSEAC